MVSPRRSVRVVELETNVREDFTITEKAPTLLFKKHCLKELKMPKNAF